MENKTEFVERINNALIECGDGRYDFLAETPLCYDNLEEIVFIQGRYPAVNVYGDSLTAMMKDIVQLF